MISGRYEVVVRDGTRTVPVPPIEPGLGLGIGGRGR